MGANLLLDLMRAPNFQKMMGMGTRIAATQPRSVPDQLTWIALNMYMLNRGNTAPASDRKNVLAAMAEAALYEPVRNCDSW